MIKLIDILTEGNKYGFDLTDFKPGGFHKVLSVLKIKPKGKLVKSKYDVYQWEWKGSGILIVTANNPITGEYASEPGKPARKKDRNIFLPFHKVLLFSPSFMISPNSRVLLNNTEHDLYH